MIITIDGPAISGKSTIARALAKELSGYYIYSGLLFRAAAYLLHTHAHYDSKTIHKISAKDRDLLLDSDRFVYIYSNAKGPQIFFDEIDITQQLHGAKMSKLASCIGTNKHIRELLKNMQRMVAQNHQVVVVDGRDSGSVVFPQAEYLFYLTATLDERARRMQQAHAKKGIELSFVAACNAIQNRDARDSGRTDAPLIKPKNAIEIDTTGLNRKEAMQKVVYYIQSI